MRHGLQRQDINTHGENDCGNNAPEGEDPAHGPVTDQEQRNIQGQGDGTYTPAHQVIQDCGDSGYTAGSDMIRCHKQGISRTGD